MPVSSSSVPQGLEKQSCSNSQADEWSSFHGTADGFRRIQERFRSLQGTRVTPQCSLSHLWHSTPALLERPHGQTPHSDGFSVGAVPLVLPFCKSPKSQRRHSPACPAAPGAAAPSPPGFQTTGTVWRAQLHGKFPGKMHTTNASSRHSELAAAHSGLPCALTVAEATADGKG